jgi:hypothetical protein
MTAFAVTVAVAFHRFWLVTTRVSMTTFDSSAWPILMVGASCPERFVEQEQHTAVSPWHAAVSPWHTAATTPSASYILAARVDNSVLSGKSYIVP